MLVRSSDMRRTLANAVLLVTLGIFFAPALTALAAPPVPICCRRGGAHHCAAMAETLGAQGTSLRSTSACPVRQAPQLGSSVVALTVSRAAHVELHRQLIIAMAVSRRHFAPVHADHLRGPPSLLV
jgi:hypothetical protein